MASQSAASPQQSDPSIIPDGNASPAPQPHDGGSLAADHRATASPQQSDPSIIPDESASTAPGSAKFPELPDLRQGIPSSFNALDFGSATSVARTEGQDPQTNSLNITEDPEQGQGRQDQEGPKEAYVSSIDKRRQAIARYAYLAATAFVVAAFAWLGRDWGSQAEANTHPDAPGGMSPMAWYARFRERLGGQFSHYTEPAFPKLLPDPPTDPNIRMPYTLVLSLEDLLVSSTWTRQDGYKIAKRPGVDYFLRYLCQYYELIIFTTVQVANGDLVLRQLDPYQFCFPIFRDGTRYMNGEHVKDLSYLNRDLSKTIIVDTRAEHVRLQPENAIVLPKWSGKKDDPHAVDLVALIPFLEYIAGMELADVRKVLASYKGKDIPAEFHRRELKAREEFDKRFSEGRSKGGRPGAGALVGLSGALGFKATPMMQIPGEQSPMEAFAEGKMLSDQMRERGRKGYVALEQQIRENGEMWLKQRAEEEKKAAEEGMKNMTSGLTGFFGSSETK